MIEEEDEVAVGDQKFPLTVIRILLLEFLPEFLAMIFIYTKKYEKPAKHITLSNSI